MAANEGDETTLSLVDVLEEDEELENEASAVLGGSDSEKCSYPEVSCWRYERHIGLHELSCSVLLAMLHLCYRLFEWLVIKYF